MREAHPQGSQRADTEVRLNDPTTLDERADNAHSCAVGLELRIPMLIDGMDNAANEAYSAWPDRLFLVDQEGRIAYRAGPGPRGFLPEELEEAIDHLLND